MRVIEYYTHGGRGDPDYAPDSYLNIGAYALITDASRDYAAMRRAEENARDRRRGYRLWGWPDYD